MEYIIWILFIIDAATMIFFYGLAAHLRLYPYLYFTTAYRKYSRNYFPRIAVFIPCKESGEEFENKIREFTSLRHPDIRIFFIVENTSEPAYAAIEREIAGTPDCYLVTAGSASSCSQKNHNLLAGIEASGEKDDVYLFLDASTKVTRKQLRRLIMPLSADNVSATTGFQWCRMQTRTFSEHLFSFMMAIQWFGIGQSFMNFLWGGMMAVKRTCFEQLGIKHYWAKTVVDDMTLVRIIRKSGARSVYVPFCINEVHRKTGSTAQTIRWFIRQILYVKYYLPALWLAGIAPLVYTAVRILILLPILCLTVIAPSPFLAHLSMLSACYLVLTLGYSYLIKRKCRDNNSSLLWVLLSPLYVILASISAAITVFARNLKWKDSTYIMGSKGIVKAIRGR
jgi:ceramide glucosyltransferase